MNKSLAYFLRKLAAYGQAGHPRTPATYVMLDSYTTYYWNCPHRLREEGLTFEVWQKVARLSERYRRFVRYCKEVKPEWKTVDHVYYADNSIEAIQVDKYGNQRRVMVAAPSGDACY